MPIIATRWSFTPHPKGQYLAVCIDVLEPFTVESKYGSQDVTEFVFETSYRNGSRPGIVRSALFNVHGLGPLGKLNKFLTSWRGVPIAEKEVARGIDLETFLGRSADVTVIHEERRGQIYARVESIRPSKKGLDPSGGYVRKKDRAESSDKTTQPDRLEEAQGRKMQPTRGSAQKANRKAVSIKSTESNRRTQALKLKKPARNQKQR